MACFIEFENYRDPYYPGDIICGKVICLFNKEKKIRGVEVKLKGKEKNKWTSNENYSGFNTFLKSQHTLKKGGNLGPGRFEYPFSFLLPIDLPSTFQGPYGEVYFVIKTKVDLPLESNYTEKKIINVMSSINFNSIINDLRLTPVCHSCEKNVGFLLWTKGPITMKVHLEKEAFVIGEVMKVDMVVANMSDKNINKIVAKLKMTTEFKVTQPWKDQKHRSIILAETSDEGVSAHEEKTYSFLLEIPKSAVVTNFQMCKLFKQYTKLKVTAVLTNSFNMDVSTFITLGHVPVYEKGKSDTLPPYSPTSSDQVPLSTDQDFAYLTRRFNEAFPPYLPSYPPPYPPLAPPSYTQSPANSRRNSSSMSQDAEAPPCPSKHSDPSRDYSASSEPSTPPAEDSASSAPSKTDVKEAHSWE